MIAIRGATTVEHDCAEEIKVAVGELLCEIRRENKLSDDKIVCIMFSNTSDLKSYYPAKVARESGFCSCALFSSLEPEIDNSLGKCIRVMLIVEKCGKPKHIYLNGAKSLRSDLTEKFAIALDGPAGSGKSTVSAIIAEKLNILCLDTGAMYRACALKCIECGISPEDEAKVAGIIDDIDIKVKYSDGKQITYLDGADVSVDIRKPEISMIASKVSALKCVRTKMVDLQRQIASENSCILDGRDIGTNVLPNAKYKFFLTASAEVRAKRRFDENVSKGYDEPYAEILEEIKKRDMQDMSRKIAPLKKAEDAVEIDTSDMTVDEVVNKIISLIQVKI